MQTFLVRIWQPSPDAPAPSSELRGVVQSLATQRTATFRSAEELIGCIVLALDRGPDVDPARAATAAGDAQRKGAPR